MASLNNSIFKMTSILQKLNYTSRYVQIVFQK